MFWIDTIKDSHKFCTCQEAWSNLKILNATVSTSTSLLEVYATPEDGNMCLLLRLRNGESVPTSLNEMNFKPHQHIKIEIYGGEVTIIGQVYDGAEKHRNRDAFPFNCPFGVWENEEKSLKLYNPKQTLQKIPDYIKST